ncbi:hypothetical protein [Kordiimonas marina]|uniref:hypothetical protein n=1 Tax=Kordiimonas marina TaxID=2872312 RepID=UPI001FF4DEA8|nr:hypothetical protein [Kordiimonas marina]MCJ9430378.1 hypothetical protein [Kordiimonas marina]
MNEPNEKDSVFLEKRRQLLKLGAAGVPMLLTMKASAAQPLHSALDCAITIPSGMCIMVGSDGAAWISTRYNYDGSKLTNGKVKQFKSASEYVLPAGSVPARYRPDGNCPTDPCSSSGGSSGDDDEGGHWGHHSQQESGFAALFDRLTLTRTAQADDTLYASDWGHSGGEGDDSDDGSSGCPTSGGDDDDNHDSYSSNHWGSSDDNHDDDEGGSSGSNDTSSCDYKIYCFDSSTQFQPGTFIDANGNWNLSGDLGLYTIVAAKYGEYYGTYNNFPGVSCMLSIMTYLNNQ